MMETIINDGICRCCATEGSFKDLDTAYHWMGSEEVYADMLRDCFDISLSKPETYNNGGICEVCITQLRNASNFKKQVQLTEKQFLKKVEESTFRANIVKIEVPRLEVDNDDIFDGNVSDGFSSPEYDVPLTKIKIEKESEKPKKRSTKASTSKAKKLKGEDGEPSSKRSRRIEIFLEPKIEKTEEVRVNIIKGRELQTNLPKHRFNIMEILTNTNATPIRCHGGVGYACCFCANRFPDPGDLKKHTIQSHDKKSKFNFIKRLEVHKFYIKLDITALKCNICDTNIDTLELLIEHLNRAHDRKLYTDIKNQILPFKFQDDRLQCFMCNNIYHKFKSLLVHMNTHYRNYVCELCGAGFVNLAILSKHTHCHNQGNFKCEFCEKEFNTHQKKRYHEKYVHTKSIAFNKCGYCNAKFKDYRKKEKHVIDVHGVKPLTINCQACDKSFTSQRDLGLHVKKSHLMYKRHRCTDCDMSFFSTAELRNHCIKHTGIRQFQCDVCHKSYARKKTLREHLRIHADDRRFKCEHCGQAFVQKCSWRSHMRCKHNEEV